ncbi:MAG: methyltransferase domain-containing protein [Kiritimatiellae bacterium]|nr:methyltransferase domain-containing protein [Kiritimatiellia bacterium]
MGIDIKSKSHLLLFEKAWMTREKRRQILSEVVILSDQKGLEIGGLDSGLSYHVHQQQGAWAHADFSAKNIKDLEHLIGGTVQQIQEDKLPFEDACFDVIVVADRMSRISNVPFFITECHRILKSDGQLVIVTAHAKQLSLIRLLRRLFGFIEEKGYTARHLFDLLKDGFDVHEVRSYSRFFVEFVHTLVSLIVTSRDLDHDSDEPNPPSIDRMYRIHSVTYPLYWVASKLDLLFFFTKGYTLVARAQRHMWRSRKIPVLIDGRSIAEATINTKIGTATPF